LHHQATWSVGPRQVSDIVQGLYHLAPEVVTSRNSRDGSQGVTVGNKEDNKDYFIISYKGL
jgi:hypothetical protein